MSNYTQTTFFTPKDTLPTSSPLKTIYGAAYDVEFGNIASAIATKFDSTTIAAQPLGFNLGTTSLPGIYFGTYSGTGFSADTSNDLFISTGGSPRLEVSNQGNVNISAPLSGNALNVTGTMAVSGAVGFNGATPSVIQTGFGTATNILLTTNFPGTAATLAQCGGMISVLVNILRGTGIIGV